MRHGPGNFLAAALMVAAIAAAVSPCQAKVFMTQEEALKTAFPTGAEVKRSTAYLTEEQAAEVEKAAGGPLPARVITCYRGTTASGGAATAYFDTHLVRTMPETLMIVVTEGGAIARIDVLSFDEPQEYLPRTGWSDQFKGRALDEDLSIRRGIAPITGATLSARAVVSAARRVLALHRVLSAGGVRP
ncbi:MAG TPA: FMN-binding protein [Candidatus Polarisedimenticolia bacterium]|jgi:Na+-translocating ferredoxin:NAD+ oxidoreductase RnfG subunit